MSDSQLPLLETSEQTIQMSRKFHAYSLGLGLTMGAFMQLSTLGANFLVLSVMDPTVIKNSTLDTIGLPVVYSGLTLVMAMTVLGFMRNLVTLSYQSGSRSKGLDNNFQELLTQLECRFVMGALVGVCVFWTATDIVLGMQQQVTFAAIALVLTLISCYVFGCCSTSDLTEGEEQNEEDMSFEETRYLHVAMTV